MSDATYFISVAEESLTASEDLGGNTQELRELKKAVRALIEAVKLKA